MNTSRFAFAVLVVASLAAPAACQEATPPQGVEPVREFHIETVVEDVVVPWAIAWLPDGRMVFTERPGRVRIVENDNGAARLHPEPLYTVPNVIHRTGAEIGLMGMAIHPRFEENQWVYLAFGHADGDERDIRVVRFRFVEEDDRRATLEEDRVLVRITPARPNHAGCRIAFGPDGKLYITTGEAFIRDLAQDRTSLAGKTLRINDDGSAPDDNPFNTPEGRELGWRPEIWSYGHRNAQGIDWHPQTQLMYQTEHGPSGERGRDQDELNLVDRGRNYGWPVIAGMEEQEGMETPLVEWSPALAPASGMFYRGDLFPELRNNFLFGGLRGEVVQRVVISDEDPRRVLHQEPLVTKYGRIRDVAEGPDGAIYFSTSNRDGRGQPARNDDRILRIVPAGD